MNIVEIQKNLLVTSQESLKALDKLREDIRGINDEIHWIENSPLPEADVVVKINQYVDSFKNLECINSFFHPDKLDGGSCFEIFAKANTDEIGVSVYDHKGIVTGGLRVDITSVLCAVFPDLVKTALKAIAKEKAKELQKGPALAERAALKQDAIARRKVLEIEEEKIIEIAEALGLEGFYRRADVDPAIVLMMEAA